MGNFSDIINVTFFTRRCRYCKKVIDVREKICTNCKNDLPRIEGDICFKCGYSAKECVCNKRASHYMRICAPFYYSGAAKRAIKLLKYSEEDSYIAESLAEDMAEAFKTHYGEMDFDFCAYVPSHFRDMQKRGYNQAELLAKSLSKIINVPCKKLLIKKSRTTPQHNLNETMRSGNLLGSFKLNRRYLKNIQNARILLCDDVKTTGSTLNECAKTLLICGAAEVDCITVCIVKKNKKTNESDA